MVWYVLVIEAIVFAVLFTTILFVSFHGGKMYSPACIHNYPSDIQEEYFKTHERVDVSYKSKKVVLAKSCGIIMFTVILTICAKLAGAVVCTDSGSDCRTVHKFDGLNKKRALSKW